MLHYTVKKKLKLKITILYYPSPTSHSRHRQEFSTVSPYTLLYYTREGERPQHNRKAKPKGYT